MVLHFYKYFFQKKAHAFNSWAYLSNNSPLDSREDGNLVFVNFYSKPFLNIASNTQLFSKIQATHSG